MITEENQKTETFEEFLSAETNDINVIFTVHNSSEHEKKLKVYYINGCEETLTKEMLIKSDESIEVIIEKDKIKVWGEISSNGQKSVWLKVCGNFSIDLNDNLEFSGSCNSIQACTELTIGK